MSMQNHQQKETGASRTKASMRRLLLAVDGCDLPKPHERAAWTQGLVDEMLNAMPMHVAILDDDGRILLVNRAWRYFAAALDRSVSENLVGVEYLKSGILGALGRRDALMLRLTLKAMLRGDVEHAQQVVRLAGTGRWYQVTLTRFANVGAARVVITHDDISAVHAAQETIKDLSQRLLDLQEEERQRIALELHDSTAQQLTAIGLSLIGLRRRLESNAEAERAFEEIEDLVQEAQKEIRTFSYLLHPPHLERDGLKQTLTRFLEGYGRRTGLAVWAEIACEVDAFGTDVQRALLRIVQEALANVHRHASATEVTLKMSATRRRLSFSVSDNGKGMKGAPVLYHADARSLGLGLPGMHARVKQLGGVLQILSGADGTTVSGRIPLGKAPA